MKKKFLPLLLLIVCNIVLVLGTLYVTRHAIYDLEYSIYSQRSHFKSLALTRMSEYYYRTTKNITEGNLAKFLSGTISDPGEIHILASFDIEKNFPVLWIGGDPSFQKYISNGTLLRTIDAMDSLDVVSKKEFLEFLGHIKSYTLTNDYTPEILLFNNNIKYLVTWVIIPEPTPGGAKYLYVTFTPSTALSFSLEAMRGKYIILFSCAVLVAGMMLILIPLTVKRFA